MRLLAASIAMLLLFSCNKGAVAQQSSTGEGAAKPAATTAPASSSTAAPPTAVQTQPAPEGKPGLTRRFNGDNAWGHLHKQVAMGPRVPGTQGHKACRKYLAAKLLEYCDLVEQQEFSVPSGKKQLPMVNLIGRFKPAESRRVLLAAHWDTRPTADMNPEGQREQPILGANDGASGVAVLLELARLFKDTPPPVGVDIVLFDGEDYGPGIDMMFLGSKHFARRLTAKQAGAYNYGILLDMIGDRDLDVHPERRSEAAAGHVYAIALSISESLGYRALKQSGAIEIWDDHLPLIERGIRIYDFIDFNYPYWHTTKDTEDKCSKDSLQIIGRIVENMVYKFPHIYAPESKPAM